MQKKRFSLNSFKAFVVILVFLSIFSGFHFLPEEIYAETTKSNKTTSITINKKKMTLYVGQSKKLKATVEGTDKKPTWSVSKKGIVKVSKGKVTALKAGKVKVTAKINNKKASCVVTVKSPTITLDYENITLNESEKITLHATIKGKSQTVTWKSSNKSIASVSKKGVVTAKGSGKATISATANGVSASCIITVEEAKSISLDKSEIILAIEEQDTLIATCKNVNDVKWKSSNKNVATVSNSGELTAVGKGTAVITAYSGSCKAECIVTVLEENPPYTENIESEKKYTNLDFDNDGKVDEFIFKQQVLTEDGHKIKFILNGKTTEVNVGPHGAEVVYYKYNTNNIYLFVFSWYASSNELFIYRYNNGFLKEVNSFYMLCGLFFKSAKGKNVLIETRLIKVSHVNAFMSFTSDHDFYDVLRFTAVFKLNTVNHSFTLSSTYVPINEPANSTYKGSTFATSSSPKKIDQNGLVLQTGMTVKVTKIFIIPYVQNGSPSCEVCFCVENNGVEGWFNKNEYFK